ncbi:uncharacterized protein LOC124266534 isoform X2 [Haliotis rubra]|uniref:uncharacterized protein LOC124266534 isoform X2 n=1 Tax=Haliotis rubra TaxID=36100 RepID=UPI001EE57E80|nr:uncharacterized protein LOC124266534 isoform X2 [Haliotis rubra]
MTTYISVDSLFSVQHNIHRMAARTVNPVPKPPRTFTDTKPVSERSPEEKSKPEQRLNIKQDICTERASKQTAVDQSREASTTKEETSPAVHSYTSKMIRFFESK